ncbi:hypothetical protein BT63DRAFT_457033 [Microthyrium microscopicum]|uniref:Uncharacterized protein n=1 Tax=Microthyrium microscopicum TaxID=703497 RepID=A0A6A6U6E7_9PEZI|nr:hypothetical protein BT63DRAFT_457033 [Microthyrium microscopicum]
MGKRKAPHEFSENPSILKERWRLASLSGQRELYEAWKRADAHVILRRIDKEKKTVPYQSASDGRRKLIIDRIKEQFSQELYLSKMNYTPPESHRFRSSGPRPATISVPEQVDWSTQTDPLQIAVADAADSGIDLNTNGGVYDASISYPSAESNDQDIDDFNDNPNHGAMDSYGDGPEDSNHNLCQADESRREASSPQEPNIDAPSRVHPLISVDDLLPGTLERWKELARATIA